MNRRSFFGTTLLAPLASKLAVAKSLDEIEIGFGTGTNYIPLGGFSNGQPYQQLYLAYRFPVSDKIEIREIAFKKNIVSDPGLTSVNAILWLSTAKALTNNPSFNMGDDQRIVFAGWAQSDSEGKLAFNLRGRPFRYNSTIGSLLVQIVVLSVTAPGGFLFGSDPFMWRVYPPLDGGPYQIQQAGLNTTLTIKVK